MVVIENECVDCDLPCIYEACPYYRVVRYYCDRCGSEEHILYWWNGEQLCLDCVANELEEVDYCDRNQ